MVINYFNIRRAVRSPAKANPVLVIDTNAPLAFSVAAQGLKPVSRRHPHVAKTLRQIELNQLAQGLPFYACPFPDMNEPKQLFRIRIAKGLDHRYLLTYFVINVKRYYNS
jgi:hypothetical protein